MKKITILLIALFALLPTSQPAFAVGQAAIVYAELSILDAYCESVDLQGATDPDTISLLSCCNCDPGTFCGPDRAHESIAQINSETYCESLILETYNHPK